MAEAQQGQKIGAITPDKNALPATNCFAGDHTAAVDIASGRLVTSSRVWMEVRDIMSTDVTTISSHNTVLSAAKVMSENKISCLVVVDDNNVTGILTETDMLTPIAAQKTDFSTILVADIMSSPVQTVQDELSVFEAGRIMEAESIKKLPVLKKNRLVGIITQTDLITALTSYGMWKDVAAIMTTDVATVQTTSTIAQAAELMADRCVSSIVVMKNNRLGGIITERDLLQRVVAAGHDPHQIRAEQVMSSPVHTVPASYSVFSAGRIMKDMHLRRLVVTDNNRLCGIITQTDIFRAIKNKLQQQEEKRIKLLEDCGNAIYTLDLKGQITYVNPAFARLLKVDDRWQLIGRHFLPEQYWWNPKDKGRLVTALKTDGVGIRDLSLKTSKGKRVYVTVFWNVTRNFHGQPSGSQGIVYDITTKKKLVFLRKTQEALRASDRRYRRITRAITDYIYTVQFKDSQPVKTVHGQASVAVTGYTPEEFAADTRLWFGMIYPQDSEMVRQQALKCVAGEDVPPLEYRIMHKAGDIRWVKSTLVAHFDSEGNILSYDGLLQDITDRKRAEEKLNRKQKNIEAIFDAAPVGMLLVDEDLIIKRANETIKQTLGRDYSQIVSRRLQKVLGCLSQAHADSKRDIDRDNVISLLSEVVKTVLDTQKPVRGLEICIDSNHSRRQVPTWLRASVEPTIIDGSRHAVVAVDDITDLKKAEEDKKNMFEQLRQQEKLKAIGTLASGVAHEINNPLTGVINYAQLINERVTDDCIKEFSRAIIEQGYRMTNIVKSLLSFSCPQKDSPRPTHIGEIVDASLSLIGSALRQDHIMVKKNIPEDLSLVTCYNHQIEQVMINLLTNARDALNCRYKGYHPDKIIKIAAGSFKHDGYEWVRTTVEDHGIGISEKIIDRVFEPFFTSKPVNEGTGLGLSVSYGIVKEHQGQFLVESEPGHFTRFHVDLRTDSKWLATGSEAVFQPAAGGTG